MDTNLLFVLGLVVLLLAVGAALLVRRRRSDELRRHFGPEYERAVHELGSRSRAEAELVARERRVSKLKLVPLTPADAQRFSREWAALQSRFVDSPQGALHEADRLVREVMLARGYPMADFDQQAGIVSVDHPNVVHHYREAHAIALRDQRGEADTEALRQAIVHYRALFADLLEVAPARTERAMPERTAPARGMFDRDHAMAHRDAPRRREGPGR
jgi:LPXTG-motif cell wall-anchored protein